MAIPDARLRPPNTGTKGLNIDWGRPNISYVKEQRPIIVPRRRVVALARVGMVRCCVMFFFFCFGGVGGGGRGLYVCRRWERDTLEGMMNLSGGRGNFSRILVAVEESLT